ncbi:MAG: hypothetical protein U5K30_14635 [Acidimicrobiales bacterium]|nr:hypothetical protein [Acidimicrobiales bacterium]
MNEDATRTTIDRRTMLGLLAGSGLGLLVGCSSDGSEAGAPARRLACDDVTGAFEATPGLVAIGTRYRELHPDDDPADAGADLPAGDLADALRAQVRADFDAGRTVDVDGWVLARTEARVAALLATC